MPVTIELQRNWRAWETGAIIDVEEQAADYLVERGYAKPFTGKEEPSSSKRDGYDNDGTKQPVSGTVQDKMVRPPPQQVEVASFECEECGKIFDSVARLKRHRKMQH